VAWGRGRQGRRAEGASEINVLQRRKENGDRAVTGRWGLRGEDKEVIRG